MSDYDTFVRRTDRSVGKPDRERLEIAIYGIGSEIGSVVAAIKKRLLADDSEDIWDSPNEEIEEELGDVMWYCFALAGIANPRKPVNIFAHDIANLKAEISTPGMRGKRLAAVLGPQEREEFLRRAAQFPRKVRDMTFDDYQSIAFLTARTQNRTLLEVCLAVLFQLSAELFRNLLPTIERELNKSLGDRPINDVLGEIAWHVSALVSIYGLRLGDIAARNTAKLSIREDRTSPTPLHDEVAEPSQQFPRRFEISFVTISKGRSRMYMNGERLGDDLTDNSYEDDGYRFHDVLHLANCAKLGWSPVLRKLMGRKRKGDARIDEVEDGARAQIVEEAVIKATHSEAQRIAMLSGPLPAGTPVRLFTNERAITFGFLRLIRDFVRDLEVHKNRYWEWEEAILAGHDIFHRLRIEEQGTVSVDLLKRNISFSPDVFVDLAGTVAGIGSAYIQGELESESPTPADIRGAGGATSTANARLDGIKRSMLDAIGIGAPSPSDLEAFQVKMVDGRVASVKATGNARDRMWERGVITFRITEASVAGGSYSTAIAISDR